MLWGRMSKHGTTGLFFPPNTSINGLKYVTLLQEKLSINKGKNKTFIFMHDGAPCHRSMVVFEHFMKSKVVTLNRRENNPDMNPTENFRSYIKSKVAKKATIQSNRTCHCNKIKIVIKKSAQKTMDL